MSHAAADADDDDTATSRFFNAFERNTPRLNCSLLLRYIRKFWLRKFRQMAAGSESDGHTQGRAFIPLVAERVGSSWPERTCFDLSNAPMKTGGVWFWLSDFVLRLPFRSRLRRTTGCRDDAHRTFIEWVGLTPTQMGGPSLSAPRGSHEGPERMELASYTTLVVRRPVWGVYQFVVDRYVSCITDGWT
jgi:hypothetical protein